MEIVILGIAVADQRVTISRSFRITGIQYRTLGIQLALERRHHIRCSSAGYAFDAGFVTEVLY